MAIIKEIQFDDYWTWLNKSDSYKRSYESAQAIFNYMEQLSDDIGENIDFDPIAWHCAFTEYENLDEVKGSYPDIESIEDLYDHTQVISESPLIIQDF